MRIKYFHELLLRIPDVLPFMFVILLLTTDIVPEEVTIVSDSCVRRQDRSSISHIIIKHSPRSCLVQISKVAPGDPLHFFHLFLCWSWRPARAAAGPSFCVVLCRISEVKLNYFVTLLKQLNIFNNFLKCCFPKVQCTQ